MVGVIESVKDIVEFLLEHPEEIGRTDFYVCGMLVPHVIITNALNKRLEKLLL